jgi:hypothetical protein
MGRVLPLFPRIFIFLYLFSEVIVREILRSWEVRRILNLVGEAGHLICSSWDGGHVPGVLFADVSVSSPKSLLLRALAGI